MGHVDDPDGRDDYWYAVTSLDDAGNESDRSAPMQPALGELTPTGLVATAADGQVELDWDAVTAPDLDGYHVERFAADVGTWTRLTNDPLTDSAWTDTDVVNDTSYTYRVIAVTDAGRQSAPSATADATPADTTAPPAPTGLSVTAGDGEVEMNLGRRHRPDLAGYYVESTSGGDAWTRLTTDPVSDTSWTDTSAVNGTDYTYRVVAVDTADNESGLSDTA